MRMKKKDNKAINYIVEWLKVFANLQWQPAVIPGYVVHKKKKGCGVSFTINKTLEPITGRRPCPEPVAHFLALKIRHKE